MLCIKCNENEGNKESGFCNGCENLERGKINGLLYLPALGLIVTFINHLFSTWSLSRQAWGMYRQMGMLTGFGLTVLLLSIMGLLVTSFAAMFFFRRSKRTRIAMPGYYLFNLAYACYLALMPLQLYGMPLGQEAIRLLSSGIIGVVLWIPYFLFSRRIPEVFNR